MKHAMSGLFLVAVMMTAPAFAADNKVTVEPGTGPTESMSERVPTMKPTDSATPGACTPADLDSAATKAKGVSDAKVQKSAMDHIDMARDSLKKSDTAACAQHLKEANSVLSTAPATRSN